MTAGQVRDDLVNQLERSILGPLEGPTESLEALPSRRYIVGVLFPSGTSLGPEEAVGEPGDGSDEEGAAPFGTFAAEDELRPASMGLSFLVTEQTESVSVRVSWATYVQPKPRGVFRRVEHASDFVLPLNKPVAAIPLPPSPGSPPKNFSLEWKTYPVTMGGIPTTIFLVNRESTSEDKAIRDQRCIFTPTIKVTSQSASILARERLADRYEDEDLESLRLLYRNRHEFAVGHSCSVHWGDVEGDRCSWVSTTFVPRFQAGPISYRADEMGLPMALLSEPGTKSQALADLERLIASYDAWISRTFASEAVQQTRTAAAPHGRAP